MVVVDSNHTRRQKRMNFVRALPQEVRQVQQLNLSATPQDMAKTRRRTFGHSDSLNSRYAGHFVKSGKWTADEEMMAEKLIHGFQTGTLPDCAEGATLRSYLARKLNCAPMRISKKFAGQCIGKHTYVANHTDDPHLTTWHKPKSLVNRIEKVPRSRPKRYRQSPESIATSNSSFYYYESDETSEEDDDSRGTPYTPPVSRRVETRKVVLGGTNSAFTPIVAHPISIATVTPSHKMDLLDFEEVYQSPCATPFDEESSKCEEVQWRELLTTMFGETDSVSPVSNIFRKDTVSSSSAATTTASCGSLSKNLTPIKFEGKREGYVV